jgi:hypothetical protein
VASPDDRTGPVHIQATCEHVQNFVDIPPPPVRAVWVQVLRAIAIGYFQDGIMDQTKLIQSDFQLLITSLMDIL